MKKLIILITILLFVSNSYSQKIIYKVENDILKGWKDKYVDENEYKLQANEVFGDKFKKPTWTGNDIVEGWTQADTDDLILLQELKTVAEQLDKFQNDGNAFYLEIRNLVKWHYGKGNITDVQYKAIRNILEPALRPLKLGNWDIAQDNINAISSPIGNLRLLYDNVKNKIDNYLISLEIHNEGE